MSRVDDIMAHLFETVSFDTYPKWRDLPDDDEDLRDLGGAGSGNFGHSGRPGQVGGSSGIRRGWELLPTRQREFAERVKKETQDRLANPEDESEDYNRIRREIEEQGEAIVYHGTADTALESIMKDGIKPGGGRGGDFWAQTEGDIIFGMSQDTPKVANAVIGGREASVFFTARKHFAEKFADLAAEVNPRSVPMILEIEIPPSALERIKFDELSPGVRFEGVIPPNWIKKVEKLSDTGEFMKAAAEYTAPLTLYAVLMVQKSDV